MALPPSSKLNSFSARPPTPPRTGSRRAQLSNASELELHETIDDAVQYLDDAFEIERLTSSESCKHKPLVDTPQQSPFTTTEFSRTSSKRKHKVAFAPFTSWDYHNSPNYASTPSDQAALRALPSSRGNETASVRSILKITKQPLADRLQNTTGTNKQNKVSAHHFKTLPDMLDAVTAQLAADGVDRSVKIDAYVSLYRTLEAYKQEVPDIDALTNKAHLLLQFIKRDVSSLNAVTNGPDVEIIKNALKLLACLSRIHEVAEKMDDSTCASFVDLSISALQDTALPKALANHHLFALAAQKYTKKILKQDRIGRLLDAVRQVQEHMKGSSVPGYLIEIYRRLVEQVPDLMVGRLSQWLDVVIPCLLSDIDDIRERSIKFAMYVALQLGSRIEITSFISERFESVSDGRTYGQWFIDELHSMLAKPATAPTVPRIWSAVNLLSRGGFHRSWLYRHLKPWLSVNQNAFVGAQKVKIAARIAWGQYILCVNPSLSTSENDRSILQKPVNAYFVEMKSLDFTTESAQASLSMYCALLYYAFRPSASFEQIDSYWEQYVKGPLIAFAIDRKDPEKETSGNEPQWRLAGSILISLFTSSAQWRETRAFDDGFFHINELPRLDSKWVRSRINTIWEGILKWLARILPKIHHNEQPGSKDSNFAQFEALLAAFFKAISDAGSKEITLSKDARSAVAHLTTSIKNLKYRDWMTPKLYARVIEVVFQELEPSPFVETYLTFASGNSGVFEVANPPTVSYAAACAPITDPEAFHRVGRDPEEPPPPWVSFERTCTGLTVPAAAHIVASLLEVLHIDWKLDRSHRTVKLVLQSCLSSTKLRFSKLQFLQACAVALLDNRSLPIHEQSRAVILEVAADIFKASDAATTVGASQIGQDYRAVPDLVSFCICRPDERLARPLKFLYKAIADAAIRETGDGGLLLAITEPHAELVMQKFQKYELYFRTSIQNFMVLYYASLILAYDVRPKHPRRDMERGWVALWGELPKGYKVADFDPYHHLYKLVDLAFEVLYAEAGLSHEPESASFLEALKGNLERAPANVRGIVLRKFQQGIVWVVEDEDKVWINHKRAETYAKVLSASASQSIMSNYPQVKPLWDTVLEILRAAQPFTSQCLDTFAELIRAGLSSRRQSIVNKTVDFWNSTFGEADALEYPPDIKRALLRLRPFVVDLKLPVDVTNPDCTELNWDEVRFVFFIMEIHAKCLYADTLSLDESIEDEEEDLPVFRRPFSHSPAPQIHTSPFPAHVAPAQSNGGGPGSGISSPFKPQPKATLRHNDSQIEFAPIESSPVPEKQDSQLLTDRQKEVASRQHHEAASMFPDIRSSPVSERLERRDLDVLRRAGVTTLKIDDLFDIPRSPEDRATTPVLGGSSHAPEDELPKSSSPMRSSPIAAALSRRSTPRKLEEFAEIQEKDDEVPSSPPRQSIEDDDDPTQEFDTQAYLAGGMADELRAAAAQSSEKAARLLVEATITPTRLAEMECSHDDVLRQARQRFEEASSFPTGTDIITGTDERNGEAQELANGSASHEPHEDIEIDRRLVPDAEEIRLSSPAPSSSGLLADAQLRAELEASTQRSRDEARLEPDSQEGPRTELTGADGSIVSDSFNVVIPATNDETSDFASLDDAQLDRIVRVFFENPDAILKKIHASSAGPADFGNSRKYRERTAKEAWKNMSAEQKTKALLPPTSTKLNSKARKAVVEGSPPAPQSALNTPIVPIVPIVSTTTRNDPIVSSTIRNDSSTSSSQTEEVMPSQKQSKRGRKPRAVPGLERRKSSRLSQLSEIPSSIPPPAAITTEPEAEPAKKKRRRMSPAASQGSSKPETEIVPATAPESKKRKRSSPAQEQSIHDSDVVPATTSQPAKKPKVAEESETVRRFASQNRGTVARASHVEVTPGSLGRRGRPSQTVADDEPEEYPEEETTAVSVPVDTIMVPPMTKEYGTNVRAGTVEDDAISVGSEASTGASPNKFFERFGGFGEYCRKMFDEARSVFGSLSKEECERVEEGLEIVEEELRSVIKEVRKVAKSKSG